MKVEVNTFYRHNGELRKNTYMIKGVRNLEKYFNSKKQDAEVRAMQTGGTIDIIRIKETELVINYHNTGAVERRIHTVIL
jgi:hypothetical protein